jgi:hypothetical protein
MFARRTHRPCTERPAGRPTMPPRTIRTLAAVLAALTIAAPAATAATPADDAVDTSGAAATSSSPDQDLWAPGAYPPPPWVPRPDAARPKTPSDLTAALAQERYYSSHGDPSPITPSAEPDIRTDDGIARLPFILAISGALVIGLATGSGLHLLHIRRRHATSPAT